jgi:transposase
MLTITYSTTLGIDVSKDTLHCTLLDSATRQVRWSRSYPNTTAGVSRLLKATSPDCLWALEPTGSYSTGVVRQARNAGRDVRLAQPRKARRFLQSIQSRAKCDRLDSAGLGLYALCHQLPPYPLKSETAERLSQLLLARKGLTQSLQQLQAQSRALPYAATALAPALSALKQQIAQVEREINTLTVMEPSPSPDSTSEDTSFQTPQTLGCVHELQKVPGIGPVTAATVVSRLAGRHFPHSDSFIAYCGLDVAVKQSGRKRGSHGLTKQGDAELRRLFYLAAQSNLRIQNSPFKAQYERERAKGLSSTAALCAVARKLARLCWSLVTHGTTYNPQRVYQQNSSQKPSTP